MFFKINETGYKGSNYKLVIIKCYITATEIKHRNLAFIGTFYDKSGQPNSANDRKVSK